MDLLSQDSASYIKDRSPSPSSVQLNISPQPSPYAFEFSVSNPYTPSHKGHGSPYSSYSELAEFDRSFGPAFDIYDPPDEYNPDEYNPAEYDGPGPSTLLMFGHPDYLSSMDSSQVAVSVMPADTRSPLTFDYSSPSSNGGAESIDGGARSRASSVSSTHLPSNQLISSSPRVDVARSFEKMGLITPSWSSSPLPGDRPMSPPQKAQSPPTLLIPDMTSPGPTYAAPPTINAPDGEAPGGPQLHIVPATPITGGGAATPTPFQPRLGTIHSVAENVHDSPQLQGWNPPAHEMSRHEEQGVSHYRNAAQLSFTFPQHSHGAANLPGSNTQIHSTEQRPDGAFLFPMQPRLRSKSETCLQPPQWDSATLMAASEQMSHSESALEDIGINDITQANARSAQMSPRQMAFSNGFSPSASPHLQPSSPFLSPDFGMMRRAKSDSGRGPGHRQSRSEDISHSSGPLLYPPASQHTQDLINRQFLHPSESLSPMRGHFRRASSGSRAERPGTWSSSSSQRMTPYPSPKASPIGRYTELPNVDATTPPSTLGAATAAAPDHHQLLGQQQGIAVVSKPNVTTGRTANASHKRRKQEANFLCPVPGCGSTFTRSFNLKGHLRSHKEEKPFICKWPGCGKGFARQHDCKRHEQLHSNYRPFTCEGCNKPFARMDALNRHLRSEGGAECSRLLMDTGRDPNIRVMHKSSLDAPGPKIEPDVLDQFGDLTGMSVML